jgi:hypothetical protein
MQRTPAAEAARVHGSFYLVGASSGLLDDLDAKLDHHVRV